MQISSITTASASIQAVDSAQLKKYAQATNSATDDSETEFEQKTNELMKEQLQSLFQAASFWEDNTNQSIQASKVAAIKLIDKAKADRDEDEAGEE